MGNFLTGASFSLVMPFMSLYVEELGARGNQIEFYSGLAVSATALASAIMSPIWGSLADRFGNKPMMVRAASVMLFTMGGLAFVPNVAWLLILRVLTGVFAGYIPNSTALIASQVPRHRAGYALGTLSTGLVTGNLMGPLLGGLLADTFGMRNVFLIVGGLLLILTLLTVFFVKEDFVPVERGQELPMREVLAQFKDRQMLLGLFVTSMIIQASAQSIIPILTLCIRHLGQTSNLMFVAGLITSAMGISSILSSGFLGNIGDRIGNHRLLLGALLYSFIMYLLCAHAQTPLQLGLIRFCYGFGTGALLPSVNSLLTKLTPKEGIARIFSYNQTFTYLGSVLGPMIGSGVAAYYGYRWVFYVTSGLVFVNLVWSLINFRQYLKVKEI
ncbi:multidrug efflux MFS transporter [Streptococcus caprae]|uniref:Multidrug efflux MFS transporter n=1 Tax=Streptococcus caprae TaxID=1640501 RepID=A0ABV8CUL9_9STRE